MAVNRRGVTLVELLVAIVISTIIIGGAYSTYTAMQKSVITSSRYTISEQGVYRKLEMLGSTLRRSTAVTSTSMEKVTLQLPGNDSLSILIHSDSIYRQHSDSLPRFWFTLDSCRFEFPPVDTGWVEARIFGSYPGRFGNYHTVTRRVTVLRKPEKVRESEWGF